MRKLPLIFLFLTTSLGTLRAADLPLLLRDDFSAGSDQWTATDAKAWKIKNLDGNVVFENLGGSKYKPPYRSPLNIALLNEPVVGDFVLTAKVQTTKESYGHRDMCLFFGYQNPANFYYIHLGQKTDHHANQIFLVNEAPRIAISEKTTDGTPWEDGKWHTVKIIRTTATGLIEVYFDDMETPTHVAHDKTFVRGQVGLGTFDDKGIWDDIELRGVEVTRPVTAKPDPKQLKFTKWTPDFTVPDPVAISFDPQGRAYVTQTMRRKANDLDIRPNSDWIPNDLSFTSTEDKENFYREQFTAENSAANVARVEDLNGDGLHDINDLTVLSERIHLIADEDGDGFADTISLYAEQLNHVIGGVAGGVLFHEGDVFVSPVPEVVKFRDTDGDDKADTREVLASGFGVHLAYAGHDMHGLFMGPDGRIYWSIGDKGIRVKTADGLDYRFPSQGGLMRCELDGSNFEVFAHGQRNIQEVSFDQYGNFFGVDNDADYQGERERLLFIEQYLDSGWRSNWQYLREGYNPWINDLMHVPWHEKQPAWFTPTLANYENGPAGFKFNPGTGLGPDYEDHFFLTSAPKGEQWAFQVKPAGDSFAMVNDHKIGEGVPLVGLNFGPDGGLYGVDWGGGYPLNESGAVWRIDVPADKAHPHRATTKALIGADFAEKAIDELVDLLGNPDQRVRLKAQYELAKREALDALAGVAGTIEADQLARIHAIWGMGQLLRAGGAETSGFVDLFTDPDPEIRAQAIKTVTDPQGRRLGLDRISGPVGENALTDALVERLEDPSQRVRIQALLGLGRIGDPAATGAIVKLLAKKEHLVSMVYLRHAGVIALAGAATIDDIVALRSHTSGFVRTCAVVALRKRGHEAVAAFLADADPMIAADAARAIHDDWMIPLAFLDLASALPLHQEHEAFARRAINANFRIGDAEAAERVATFVAEGSAPEAVLEAALEALRNWTEPPVLDLVVGRYRALEPRDPMIVASAIEHHLDALLTSPFSSVRGTAMALARDSSLTIPDTALRAVLGNADAKAALRAEALRSLISQKVPGLEADVTAALQDRDGVVREVALGQLVGTDPSAALEEISRRLADDPEVSVKQHAIRMLRSAGGGEILASLVAELKSGTLEPALQLDVIEAAKDDAFAADTATTATIAELEASWMAAMATDMAAPYRVAMAGGNVERGHAVFMNHEAAQCVRCHKVQDGSGSNVGPNLKEIGKKKDAAYMLESLVDPQKVVAKGYGNISLTLKDGTSVAGQFRGEKDGRVTIRDLENKETKIKVEDIAERSPVVSTMPPMGFILKKDELRDVIAYLQSLKG